MNMPAITRGRALAYLVAVTLALVVGGRFLIASDSPDSVEKAATTFSALEVKNPASTTAAADQLLVHVTGAVRRPGLYRLPAGSRIDDAIRAAGGPRRRAALELVNLAAPIADGQQVAVPGARRAGAQAVGDAVAGTSSPAPVHLNSATLEELDSLPGVGPVTAQRILDYRAQHGAFASVDDLDAVPGIGPARLEQLRELLTL